MKAKPYFSRKNLIVIALSAFYSIILLFVGFCIDGAHNFVTKKNPINMIAQGMNFKSITAGVSGFIALILLALYIIVGFVMVIFEINLSKLNGRKLSSKKTILNITLIILASLIFSLGVGVVIQSPLSGENIGNMFTFLGECLVISLMIYLLGVVLIGSILMFIVNFILIDKPFKFKSDDELPEPIVTQDEDEEQELTSSFDGVNNLVNGATSSTTGNVIAESQKVEELYDREKVFPSLSAIDARYNGFEIENIPSDNLTLEELCVKFRNYLAKEEKLYFSLNTIRTFISSLNASHFMILEGLSGTGKSSLPRYFAKFTSSKVLFVPVQATWRDKTNILGYFNDFSKTYQETDFLNALYEANYNPDQINIFVLDEMNISRVEYYFADFLSTLEFPEEDWKLRIMHLPYNFIAPARLEDGYVRILNNCYFVGTANKDDSTFSISDKVYDRSITIDFENRNEPFEVNEDVAPIKLSSSKLKSLFNEVNNNDSLMLSEDDLKKFTAITAYIYEEFDVAFGNRILSQINTFVPTFVACGGKKEDALDFILTRKVLYKLEGRFEEYVKPSLKKLLSLIQKTYGANVFSMSEKEINNLIRKL